MLRFAKRTALVGLFQGPLVLAYKHRSEAAGGFLSPASCEPPSSAPSASASPLLLPPSSATYPANNPTEDRIVTAAFDVRGGAGKGVTRWDVGAVFDGHGGWQVAQMASQRLVPEIMRQLAVEDGQTQVQAPEQVTREVSGQAAVKDDDANGNKAGWGYLFGQSGSGKAASVTSAATSAAVPAAWTAEEEVARVVRAFHLTDRYFVDAIARPAFTAGFGEVASVGSCVCVALLARSENRLLVANLGDCRAVLGSCGSGSGGNWSALQLTRDHNCRLREEQEALLRAHPTESIGDGGNLVVCKSPHACYVKGRLQLTRALGDLYLKHAEFNGREGAHRSSGRHIPAPYHPPYVLNTPDVFRVDLNDGTRGRDRVLVLASDGVWDYVQPQEAVDLLYAFLHGYLAHLQLRAAGGGVGAALLQLDAECARRLTALLGGKSGEDFDVAPPAPAVRFPQYEALFQDMYRYADQRNQATQGGSPTGGSTPPPNASVESIAANMLVEVTLRKAAAEAGLPGGVDQLKALPPGSRRRSVHDDTTVVVMYL